MASRIGQMHRPAESFAEPISAAEDFRHDVACGRAEHNRIAVTAIARHHGIIFASGSKRAHDARLCTIGEMRVPANHPRMLREGPLDALLKFADAHHLRVHPDKSFFAQCRCLTHSSPHCYCVSPACPMWQSASPTGTSLASGATIFSSMPSAGESSS